MSATANFVIRNWINQALPSLKKHAQNKKIGTEEVINLLLLTPYSLEATFANQMKLMEYAEQIEAELKRRGFTCTAEKWSFAKP